jgi:RNA ligase
MLYDKLQEFDIPIVNIIDPFENIADLVLYTRDLTNFEGFVIAFNDGHRLKIKADQYVLIHKVKEKICVDRHILNLLLNNQLDDVLPLMTEIDFNRVKEYEEKFYRALNLKISWLEDTTIRIIHQAKKDRKYLATVLLPASNLQPEEYKFVYKVVDGHVMYDAVMDHVRSRLGSTVKYNELAAWLGLIIDQEEK